MTVSCFARFVFAILLFLVASPTANQAATPEGSHPPFRVTVDVVGRPRQYIEHNDGIATVNGKQIPTSTSSWVETYPVLLRVTNVSDVPQSFTTASCSWYDDWTARVEEGRDGDSVTVGVSVPCWANYMQTIMLKPRESYQKQTIVSIHAVGNPHSVRFQVGFRLRPDQKQGTLWSNSLAVIVTKANRI